tara:strand:- start:2803 stop:2967 length:165 start_codon:yes stop_codon:yes gene_type:complete
MQPDISSTQPGILVVDLNFSVMQHMSTRLKKIFWQSNSMIGLNFSVMQPDISST